MKPLLAWSSVLLACAVVGYRIVTNPATPHPVTAGVIVAVLILVGVYLALAEYFSADQRCQRYERKVQRDMAKNLIDFLISKCDPRCNMNVRHYEAMLREMLAELDAYEGKGEGRG